MLGRHGNLSGVLDPKKEDRLFRVGLVLRPCLVEGGELGAGGVDREDLGIAVERRLQPPGIINLRHQAEIGERDVAAEGVGAGADQLLHRVEAVGDPVVIPGVDLGLLMLERVLQIAQRADIVERMDIAGDDLGDRPHLGALQRIARQERGLRMDLVEILDDRHRLDEHVAGIERERGEPHVRVDGAVFRLAVDAAFLLQMDRDHLADQALEIERDAHPVGGRRAEIGIELHGGPPGGQRRCSL